MASTIVTKNSSTASAVPLTGDLTQGELAVNVTDKRLFTKNSGGTVVELGTNPASLALPNGTANGVAYLNGSKVVTTGSALTFDGTSTFNVVSSSQYPLISVASTAANNIFGFRMDGSTGSGNGRDWRIEQGRNAVGQFNITDITAGNTVRYSIGSDGTAIWNVGAGTGSEQMRLTSTGLGIGTSSPGSKLTVLSTGSTIEAKQSSAGAATYYVMDTTVETNGKRWRFGYTGASGTTPGMFSFLNVTDNVIGPVIDSSGNLGLGVTPSAWNTYKALEIGRVGNFFAGYSGGTETTIGANAYYSTGWKYAVTGASATRYMTDNTGGHYWYNAPSGTAGNAITFTQAMTLDAGGNLLVGTTTVIRAGKISVSFADASSRGIVTKTDVTTTSAALLFTNPNGDVGNITTSGSATAYNTSSDYRLKHDVAPMTGALAKVAALKPVTYKWNADNSDGEGFIAHELAEVVPQCVTGEKDAVDEDGNPKYQGIDTSFLIATLTAAIQEQQALITQLQADVAALKGN